MASVTVWITQEDIDAATAERHAYDLTEYSPATTSFYDISRLCPTARALNRLLHVQDVEAGASFARTKERRLRLTYSDSMKDWVRAWTLGHGVEPGYFYVQTEVLHVRGDETTVAAPRPRSRKKPVNIDQMVEEDYN